MNPSKDKGTTFESLIVDGLHDMGYPYAERRAQRGVNDGGDIAGIPGVVAQCKRWVSTDLSGWWKECQQQVSNAKADLGVVVHKRKGKASPAEQWVTMDLATFCLLLHEAGR